MDLDSKLRDAGLDSDSATFDEILKNLQKRRVLTPDEFAAMCAYVILAGGFSQKTAKIKHAQIINYLEKAGKSSNSDNDTPSCGACACNPPLLPEGNLVCDLLKIFNNKNKINAIVKIWQNRREICTKYYEKAGISDKLDYLSSLPHIGKITANHLARNLGENVVKYDIWIQRLGFIFASKKYNQKNENLLLKINNAKLDPQIKNACDDMFTHLEKETGYPRGYIDVVLWKACQNGLIPLRRRGGDKVAGEG